MKASVLDLLYLLYLTGVRNAEIFHLPKGKNPQVAYSPSHLWSEIKSA